jgi:hypothetical protein
MADEITIAALDITTVEAALDAPVKTDSKGDFFYKKYLVRFNSAGDCFVEKDGRCLGCAYGTAEHARSIIDEWTKGE